MLRERTFWSALYSNIKKNVRCLIVKCVLYIHYAYMLCFNIARGIKHFFWYLVRSDPEQDVSPLFLYTAVIKHLDAQIWEVISQCSLCIPGANELPVWGSLPGIVWAKLSDTVWTSDWHNQILCIGSLEPAMLWRERHTLLFSDVTIQFLAWNCLEKGYQLFCIHYSLRKSSNALCRQIHVL